MKIYQGMVFKNAVGGDGKRKQTEGVTEKGELKSARGDGKARAVGGQPGHPGKSRKNPTRVDRVVVVHSTRCPDCGGKLSRSQESLVTHTVTDIPPLTLERVVVTEYRKERQYCQRCRQEVIPIPKGVIPRARFGINLISLVLLLRYRSHLTLGKISKLLLDVYGIRVTTSALVNLLKRTSLYLGKDYTRLLKEIRGSPVKHADETGWRIGNQSGWLWAFVTDRICYYTIEKTRGKGVAERVLSGSRKTDVLVRDDYVGYKSLPLTHQSCWAHLLRKARDLSCLKGHSPQVKTLSEELFEMFSNLSLIVK